MDVRNTEQSGSLAEILLPFRAQALADATGRSRTVAHDWRTGKALPDVASLPALAALIRIDLGELTQLVADESTRTDLRFEGRRAS